MNGDKQETDDLLCSQPISDELMYELEEAANDKARGMQRRLTLVACARSLEKLCDIRLEEPDAFKEMLEMVNAYKAHAEGLLSIATTAVNRMNLANILNEEEDDEAFAKAVNDLDLP
jgi:hypothetical protein